MATAAGPADPVPTPLLTGMLSHPPIPITDMAEHMERLKANDSLKLSQEYEVSRGHCGMLLDAPALVIQHCAPPRLNLPFPCSPLTPGSNSRGNIRTWRPTSPRTAMPTSSPMTTHESSCSP